MIFHDRFKILDYRNCDPKLRNVIILNSFCIQMMMLDNAYLNNEIYLDQVWAFKIQLYKYPYTGTLYVYLYV